MKSFLLPFALFAASTAVAQTTSCAADYIVEACLASESAKLASCQHSDYACKCEQYKNILTCFNNCPNDSRLHDYAGQRDIFCSYVTQFATSSTALVTATKSAESPANTTPAADSTSGETDSTETTTADGPTNTNSAADLALNAGGVLAAVAGAVAGAVAVLL